MLVSEWFKQFKHHNGLNNVSIIGVKTMLASKWFNKVTIKVVYNNVNIRVV